MSNSTKCPICGKSRKPWFKYCYECSEKEKQKPVCEVCGKEVPENHYLCKEHWRERKEQEGKLKAIDKIKEKKTLEFKEKFEGKYYFNSMKIKSKSELLICYFLSANGVNVMYERELYIGGKDYRPDFVIEDDKGNIVILEHFGWDGEDYIAKKKQKIYNYSKLCDKEDKFYFIKTDEEDIKNLKEKLGKKLNGTPVKKPYWK